MPRDPYPFPRLQNDTDFCGEQGKQVSRQNVEIVEDLGFGITSTRASFGFQTMKEMFSMLLFNLSREKSGNVE